MNSNETMLSLSNLDVMSTGRYRCKVSTEAAIFSMESDYGDLLVSSITGSSMGKWSEDFFSYFLRFFNK